MVADECYKKMASLSITDASKIINKYTAQNNNGEDSVAPWIWAGEEIGFLLPQQIALKSKTIQSELLPTLMQYL